MIIDTYNIITEIQHFVLHKFVQYNPADIKNHWKKDIKFNTKSMTTDLVLNKLVSDTPQEQLSTKILHQNVRILKMSMPFYGWGATLVLLWLVVFFF